MEIDGQRLGVVVVVAGLLLVVVGLLVAAGVRPPFGRLPGDISGGGDVRWSFPLGTSLALSLVLSVVLTVVLNIIIRR